MKNQIIMKRGARRYTLTQKIISTLILMILAAPLYLVASQDICPPAAPDYNISFCGLSPAKTPKEANDGFAARAERITNYNACRNVDQDGESKPWNNIVEADLNLDFTTAAIAKLEKGGTCPGQTKDNLTQVNEALKSAHVRRKSGTDFPSPCLRSGNYDFALRGLVTILYRYGPYGPEEQKNKLRQDVYDYVLNNLLNQRGPHDPAIEKVDFDSPCSWGDIPESENHILMIETSRYLTNQLLLKKGYDPNYDNEKNGFNEWMLRHLQQFLQNDFDEYNSRPYQTYSILAIQNLYDFAYDERVKRAAQMVLDYLSAKFAVSSNQLRRSVPFRRQKEKKDFSHLMDDVSDSQTWRFVILAGVLDRLVDMQPPYQGDLLHPGMQPPYYAHWGGQDIMQLAAVGTYRVPDLILDLVMNQEHKSYYQRIKHDGVEIYASSPEFLITGGGFWTPSRHGSDELLCYKDVGWAVPTTLMPTGGGVDYQNFIRIDGDRTSKRINPLTSCRKEDSDRVNTGVAPGFASGLNPIIPQSYAGCSGDKIGPWTFINGPQCNSNFHFYAAVYRKEIKDPAGWGYGFFEAASSKGLDFAKFKERVLSQNGGLDLKQFEPNDYVTVTGRRIRFVPDVPSCDDDYAYCGNKYRWGIISTGDPVLGCQDRSDIGTWPLAQGDIINSDGHSGYLTIDNPFLNQRLILNMRDPLRPERIEIPAVGRSEREAWVDFNYAGKQCGTFDAPYNTLSNGVRALPWNGGTLKVKAGSTTEPITIPKRIRIEAHGGKVNIKGH